MAARTARSRLRKNKNRITPPNREVRKNKRRGKQARHFLIHHTNRYQKIKERRKHIGKEESPSYSSDNGTYKN